MPMNVILPLQASAQDPSYQPAGALASHRSAFPSESSVRTRHRPVAVFSLRVTSTRRPRSVRLPLQPCSPSLSSVTPRGVSTTSSVRCFCNGAPPVDPRADNHRRRLLFYHHTQRLPPCGHARTHRPADCRAPPSDARPGTESHCCVEAVYQQPLHPRPRPYLFVSSEPSGSDTTTTTTTNTSDLGVRYPRVHKLHRLGT